MHISARLSEIVFKLNCADRQNLNEKSTTLPHACKKIVGSEGYSQMAFKITVVCKIWRVKALHSAHDENGSMKCRVRKPWAISFMGLRKLPVFTKLRNDQLTCENNLGDKSKKGLHTENSLLNMENATPILIQHLSIDVYITNKSVSSNQITSLLTCKYLVRTTEKVAKRCTYTLQCRRVEC